eukprot:sb/3466628/
MSKRVIYKHSSKFSFYNGSSGMTEPHHWRNPPPIHNVEDDEEERYQGESYHPGRGGSGESCHPGTGSTYRGSVRSTRGPPYTSPEEERSPSSEASSYAGHMMSSPEPDTTSRVFQNHQTSDPCRPYCSSSQQITNLSASDHPRPYNSSYTTYSNQAQGDLEYGSHVCCMSHESLDGVPLGDSSQQKKRYLKRGAFARAAKRSQSASTTTDQSVRIGSGKEQQGIVISSKTPDIQPDPPPQYPAAAPKYNTEQQCPQYPSPKFNTGQCSLTPGFVVSSPELESRNEKKQPKMPRFARLISKAVQEEQCGVPAPEGGGVSAEEKWARMVEELR